MLKIFPIVLAFVLVVGYGVVEAVWTDRYAESDEIEQACLRLENIPTQVGDWQGKELQLEQKFLDQGEVSGYILRDYVNRKTGELLKILIICGKPGPTSVHTPDVCYRGAGYRLHGERQRHTEMVPSMPQPVDLWSGDFRKTKSTLPEELRIYWTWTHNGHWEAPTYPRFHYVGQSTLYKMYVVHAGTHDAKTSEKDVCLRFMHEFLPVVNHALFPINESNSEVSQLRVK